MTSTIVHVRCGDDIGAQLQASGLPGAFVRWADPLCEGPTPAGLAAADFRAVRAAWLAPRVDRPESEVAADLAAQDARLADLTAAADEIVLWFEHDLFDQIILAHLLDRLQPLAAAGKRLSLVCIGEHPDVPRFVGLGQLAPAHLPPLFDARTPLAVADLTLAADAWAAFTAPAPDPLLAFLATADRAEGDGEGALPFLALALQRHLRQFPWKADGLALTEWLALDVIDLGVDTPAEAFRHVAAREEAPWQGDLLFFAWLRDLCAGPRPLLADDGGAWPDGVRLRLTERGRGVLLGREDALAGRPLDRWLGGVHLTSESPHWRWDFNQEALVRVS